MIGRILIGLIVLTALLSPAAAHAGPAESIEMLLQQADAKRTTDPDEFEDLLDRLNGRKAQATPRQREQLAYLNAFASAYRGRFDLAIASAGELARSASDVVVRYRSGLLVVNSYAATRDFGRGLRQLRETLALAPRIEDTEVRMQGPGVAAIIHNQVGQYALAREYTEQVLEARVSARTRCYVGTLRLEALFHLGELPTEDAAITRVIQQCTREREPIWANFSRILLAKKWAAQGRHEDAYGMLRASGPEIEATRYSRLIGEAESLLGELRLAAGDPSGARTHAQAAVTQSEGIANALPLVVAYRTLYRIAERQGNTTEALKYHRLYADAELAYLNETKARELAYLMFSHELQHKMHQIGLLNRQNQVLELQQRIEKKSRQNTQLLAAFLALLVASIGYWAWKMRRMQVSFRKLAETDMLTGIGNRHHFTRQAEDALQYCRRNGEDVGLIMFDLDHFKSVNDRFGHVVGDFVLMQVAQACKANGRRNDRFARIGGEEFAILLPGCDLEATERAAHQCRRRIAELDTSESGHAFAVTASFGVTTASISGYDLSRMMSHADQLLYRSKHEGRNRVHVARSANVPRAEADTPSLPTG